MQMFRSSESQNRRRRLSLDDSNAEIPAASRRVIRGVRYTEKVRREHHLRYSDLVPRRRWGLMLLALAGLTVIAGLLAAHVLLPDIRAALHAPELRVFDLTSPASLASWASSMALLVASGLSVAIFSLRRCRLDDYRGRYRMWLAMAAIWLVMSVDTVAGMHELIGAIAVRTSRWPQGWNGNWAWFGGWSILLGTLSLRLWGELKACRTAQVSLVLALGCWLLGSAARWTGHWMVATQQQLLAEGAMMLGHLAILFSLTSYTRHILLDASGLLDARAKKASARRGKMAGEADDEQEEDLRVDTAQNAVPAPHFQPRGAEQNKPATPASTTLFGKPLSGASSSRDQVNSQLSKADRKRLKQEARQQQNHRAA